MKRPVHLALVWHMHQPEYRDPWSGIAMLPWVRLHAARHYFDMAALAAEHPDVRQTFNLTPVLLSQLQGEGGGAAERLLAACRRAVGGGAAGDDREFLLGALFMANETRHIATSPRYRELLSLRGPLAGGLPDSGAAERFSDSDMLDLIAWFQLSWTSALWPGAGRAAELRLKGRDFSVEEVEWLLDLHLEIARGVVPAYASLARRGVAELSTTPFYHPIGPLLLDVGCAHDARPDMILPRRTFHGDRDLAWHLAAALRQHERLFGVRPRGMWPAEGGVSDEFAAAAAARGMEWIASDDQVLRASLHKSGFDDPDAPSPHHAAWRLECGSSIIFRDHELSDLVGF
ncbi:MAG: glycoside hydrolase, partial [bacterium]